MERSVTDYSINFNGKIVNVGIDVHKQSWRVTAMVEGILVKAVTIKPYYSVLKKVLSYFSGAHIRVAYEAGPAGFSLYDELTADHIECMVVPPSLIPVESGNRVKTLERVRAGAFGLLILDLQLPGLDGLSLCGELRRDRRTHALPIIMLTARGEEADRVAGLEVGADDYMVQPFSPREIVARVRALRRRLERKADEEAPLVLGALEIDHARHTVRWQGQPVHLTAKEFALLVALVEAKGRVLSRPALLEAVWGYSYAEGTRTVDVHVRRLREKLPGIAGRLITVKSLGYRMARESEG